MAPMAVVGRRRLRLLSARPACQAAVHPCLAVGIRLRGPDVGQRPARQAVGVVVGVGVAVVVVGEAFSMRAPPVCCLKQNPPVRRLRRPRLRFFTTVAAWHRRRGWCAAGASFQDLVWPVVVEVVVEEEEEEEEEEEHPL